MRFSEKSFELRFCAALTAAAMPFNRNPQWFGLTQRQERIAGFDAMLSQGGKLLIFQFKSIYKGKIRINIEQLKILSNICIKFKDSVFYCFPSTEFEEYIIQTPCLFMKSYIIKCEDLYHKLNGVERMHVFFSIDCCSNEMRSRKMKIPIKNTCEKFGCYCLFPIRQRVCMEVDKRGNLISFLPSFPYRYLDKEPGRMDLFQERGIPIERGGKAERLEQRLFGEFRKKRWDGRLAGLFFPD